MFDLNFIMSSCMTLNVSVNQGNDKLGNYNCNMIASICMDGYW